jgi:hypothetical protein
VVEVMGVVAGVAVLAAIAIPGLSAARLETNETAAIATLRSLVAAQAEFHRSACADEDFDGKGEFGGFLELSGAVTGRMTGPLASPVLSGAFRVLNPNGEVSRSGYLFRLWLPGAGGVGVAEDDVTGFAIGGGQAPDLAERTWCCYAWPARHGRSGCRTFFASAAGDVLGCDVSCYSGTGCGPAADAAFEAPGSVTGAVDAGGAGQNPGGQVWRRVG